MPLFSAIVGVVSAVGGFIASATGIGGMLLRTAVGIGLSYAAQALAGKPKPQSQAFSLQGTIRAGGTVPRSFIVGRGVTAGSLVYPGTWGEPGNTPNALLVQVIALSDLPVKGLAEVWVNGEKVSLLLLEEHADLGFPVAEYRKEGMDHLWVKFYDGTQTVADPYLVEKFGEHENFPYEPTRVGFGVAYVIVTSRVNDTLWTGFPEFKFVVDGIRLYDKSKDSSAGGDGPQRLDNPATWGGDGDDLPVAQLDAVLRGIYYGGKWLYGLQGVAAPQLPAAAFIAAINRCRTSVETDDGAEPLYRCGGEVMVNTRTADTVEALLTSCNGRLAEIGGIYKPAVGSNNAPVGSFSDGDIISTSPQSFTPFHGLADTINGIAARYPEPAEGWNVKGAPTRLAPDFEAQDGNRRLLADVDYSMVPYKWQVQRLMEEALSEARRQRRHTHTMPPAFWVYEPLDVIAFDSDRHGYAGKAFRIDGMNDLANLDALVDLTEVDPAEFDPGEITYIPVVDGPVVIARPAPQPMTGWQAFPDFNQDHTGEKQSPTIRVQFAAGLDDVREVHIQARFKVSGIIAFDGTIPYADVPGNPKSVILNGDFKSNTIYEVRGKYIPFSSRPTEWSAWLEVTTPAITEEAVADAVRRKVAELVTEAAELRRLAKIVADLDASSFTERQELVREIRVQVGNARAFFNEKVSTLAGVDAAQALLIQNLEAALETLENDLTAYVDNSLSAAVGPGSAIAEALLETGVAIDDLNSKVSTRYVAAVDTEGAVALWELKATVQNVSAGQRVYVVSDGMGGYVAHVGIIANKFYVLSGPGETPEPVFLIDDGNVYLRGDLVADGSITAQKLAVATLSAITANIGTVSAGRIESADGLTYFDLDDGEIVVDDGV